MLKVLSSWVKIETSQLSTGEGVQEYCVYFASQHHRAWPWRFMRPHHLTAPPVEINKKHTGVLVAEGAGAAPAGGAGVATAVNGAHPHHHHNEHRALVGMQAPGRNVPGDNVSSGDEVNVTIVAQAGAAAAGGGVGLATTAAAAGGGEVGPAGTAAAPGGGEVGLAASAAAAGGGGLTPIASAAAAGGGGLRPIATAAAAGGSGDAEDGAEGGVRVPLSAADREAAHRFSSGSFNKWMHPSGEAAAAGGGSSTAADSGTRDAGRVRGSDPAIVDQLLQASGPNIELQPTVMNREQVEGAVTPRVDSRLDSRTTPTAAATAVATTASSETTAAAAESKGRTDGASTRFKPRRSSSWSFLGKKARGAKVEFAADLIQSRSVRGGRAYQPDTKDQNPSTPPAIPRHGPSKSNVGAHGLNPWAFDDAASSKGQELLSELGQQVGATGGLHTSKRRRRKSQRYRESIGAEPGTRLELEAPNVCFAMTPGAALAATTVAGSCYSPRAAGRTGASVYSGASGGSFARLLYAAGQARGDDGNGPVVLGTAAAAGGGGEGGVEEDGEADANALALNMLKRAASAGLSANLPSTRPAMPLVAPLPDQQTLASLRMTGAASSRGAGSVHGTEVSAAGFEGTNIGYTCSALMSGSWLWARQLLVHDLGSFK